MKDKIKLINTNNIWKLTNLPKDKKVFNCKWVLGRTIKVDGSFERYKIILLVKGYTQESSVDFVNTYSPVMKFTSVKIIMYIVARMNLKLH